MVEIIHIGPSVLLFLSWLFLRSKEKGHGVLIATWFGLIIILVSVGTLIGHGEESTQTAVNLLFTSTIWFSGPFLIFTIKKKWKFYWVLLGSVVLPFLSYFICMMLMLISGEIWGV
jgi:hypothetical protein